MAAVIRDRIWYWVQLAIWPCIRNAGDCVYCIFLRGMLAGVALTLTGVAVWLMT